MSSSSGSLMFRLPRSAKNSQTNPKLSLSSLKWLHSPYRPGRPGYSLLFVYRGDDLSGIFNIEGYNWLRNNNSRLPEVSSMKTTREGHWNDLDSGRAFLGKLLKHLCFARESIAINIPVKGDSDRSYRGVASSNFLKRRTLFTPPKPAEVDRAIRTSFFLAWLGT